MLRHRRRHTKGVSPFDFAPSGAETGGVDISLPAGKKITINWGDGNSTNVSGPVNSQNYTNAYAGAGTYSVTFRGDYDTVTRLDINTVLAEGTTSRIGLLSGLTYFLCTGSNTVSGDIQNLPSGLIYFNCTGSNTVSGDIQNLPSDLTYFSCSGSNTISDYTTKAWTTKPTTFILTGNSALSESEVDQLFIDFDDDLVWAAGNTITITGSCAAPSAASAAARANIAGEGCTITTN